MEKKIKVQSRAKFVDVALTTALCFLIYEIIWFFLHFFNFSAETISTTLFYLQILAVVFVVITLISALDNSLYISDVVFTQDSIKFIYKKGQKETEVQTILKNDIKKFNLEISSYVNYAGNSVSKGFKLTTNIDLNNGETITVQEKLFSTIRENSKFNFVKALLTNKDDVPNLNYACNGNSLTLKESLKSCYEEGKDISYWKKLKYSFKEMPLILKIFMILGLLIIIGMQVLIAILSFFK